MVEEPASNAYPAAMLELSPRAVHVWTMPLDLHPEKLSTLARSLSASERNRADRFRFEQHRRRFMAGRGFVRNVLALYLAEDPGCLEFRYGAFGKPALAAGPMGPVANLHFNLAHSEDLALLAVSRAGPLGIDLERIRVLDDAEELVARFFCPAEFALFHSLPTHLKCAAFFNLWTRKEAWLKATGEGIGHSLHRVQVSFLPEDPARLVELPTDLGNIEDWSLAELVTWPGFTAALALRGGAPRICYRTWEPGGETAAAGRSTGNRDMRKAAATGSDMVVPSEIPG